MDDLMPKELQGAAGAVAVATCGVGALADDIRRSARMQMMDVNIDLYEEAFTW